MRPERSSTRSPGNPHRTREGRRPHRSSRESAKTPVEWLLAHGCCVRWTRTPSCFRARSRCTCAVGVLHREVPTCAVRTPSCTTTTRSWSTAWPPAPRRAGRPPVQLCSTTGRSAPPGVLRSGGLGVRDLRSAAAAIDVDESSAALVVETGVGGRPAGHQRGGRTTSGCRPPRTTSGARRTSPTDGRSSAAAWLTTHARRQPGRHGVGGDWRPRQRPHRRRSSGSSRPTSDAGCSKTSRAFERGHSSPRSSRWCTVTSGGVRGAVDGSRDDLVRWTLHEANAIGVCARVVRSAARTLLLGSGDPADATALLRRAAARAGRPRAAAGGPHGGGAGAARVTISHGSWRLLADVESSGGATVFRFTEGSVSGRWTPDAPPPSATPSSRASAAPRSPSPWRTSSTTSPDGTVVSGWARRPRTCGATTPRCSTSCSPDAAPTRCGCAGWPRPSRCRRPAPDVLIDRLRDARPCARGGGRRRQRRREPARRASHRPTRPAPADGQRPTRP